MNKTENLRQRDEARRAQWLGETWVRAAGKRVRSLLRASFAGGRFSVRVFVNIDSQLLSSS